LPTPPRSFVAVADVEIGKRLGRAGGRQCGTVGVENDTAQFAANSIRRSPDVMGRERHPQTGQLMAAVPTVRV
jgi:hypothetical protein